MILISDVIAIPFLSNEHDHIHSHEQVYSTAIYVL